MLKLHPKVFVATVVSILLSCSITYSQSLRFVGYNKGLPVFSYETEAENDNGYSVPKLVEWDEENDQISTIIDENTPESYGAIISFTDGNFVTVYDYSDIAAVTKGDMHILDIDNDELDLDWSAWGDLKSRMRDEIYETGNSHVAISSAGDAVYFASSQKLIIYKYEIPSGKLTVHNYYQDGADEEESIWGYVRLPKYTDKGIYFIGIPDNTNEPKLYLQKTDGEHTIFPVSFRNSTKFQVNPEGTQMLYVKNDYGWIYHTGKDKYKYASGVDEAMLDDNFNQIYFSTHHNEWRLAMLDGDALTSIPIAKGESFDLNETDLDAKIEELKLADATPSERLNLLLKQELKNKKQPLDKTAKLEFESFLQDFEAAYEGQENNPEVQAAINQILLLQLSDELVTASASEEAVSRILTRIENGQFKLGDRMLFLRIIGKMQTVMPQINPNRVQVATILLEKAAKSGAYDTYEKMNNSGLATGFGITILALEANNNYKKALELNGLFLKLTENIEEMRYFRTPYQLSRIQYLVENRQYQEANALVKQLEEQGSVQNKVQFDIYKAGALTGLNKTDQAGKLLESASQSIEAGDLRASSPLEPQMSYLIAQIRLNDQMKGKKAAKDAAQELINFTTAKANEDYYSRLYERTSNILAEVELSKMIEEMPKP